MLAARTASARRRPARRRFGARGLSLALLLVWTAANCRPADESADSRGATDSAGDPGPAGDLDPGPEVGGDETSVGPADGGPGDAAVVEPDLDGGQVGPRADLHALDAAGDAAEPRDLTPSDDGPRAGDAQRGDAGAPTADADAVSDGVGLFDGTTEVDATTAPDDGTADGDDGPDAGDAAGQDAATTGDAHDGQDGLSDARIAEGGSDAIAVATDGDGYETLELIADSSDTARLPDGPQADGGADVPEVGDNPCTPNPCGTPPRAVCVDSQTRQHFALPATCSDAGGVPWCSYATWFETCLPGEWCENGWCVPAPDPTPCDPNPCVPTPAPYCLGTLLVYFTFDPGLCEVYGTDYVCDYGRTFYDCGEHGQQCVRGNCDGPASLYPSAGEIVVTEVMIEPLGVSADVGQWFEIQNVADGRRNLAGVGFSSDHGEEYIIPRDGASHFMEPGERWLLARAADLGLPGAGVEADLVYTGFDLTSRAISIVGQNGPVDTVLLWPDTAWPIEPGAALSLSPDRLSADANDDPAAWCFATYVFESGYGNRGTPGAPNDPCDP